ncbi:hypothetical protein E2C01_060616 [Portunus trituberculatus]|uniref:Uncharacterized protein n=1 Tax=Portunus trituberculatus TaxID=210409 RepID=A0A5B7HBX7_PORTR|nr:hypothetical protein [Portunus trituberculatus]
MKEVLQFNVNVFSAMTRFHIHSACRTPTRSQVSGGLSFVLPLSMACVNFPLLVIPEDTGSPQLFREEVSVS